MTLAWRPPSLLEHLLSSAFSLWQRCLFTATATDFCVTEQRDVAEKCTAFAEDKIDTIPQACCGGLKKFRKPIKDKADAVKACYCHQSLVRSIITEVDLARLYALPDLCDTRFGFSLDLNFDCHKAE
ncbi:Non-specific lipid-transfer protein 3-like protein [Drosera capensis]